jgi:hypothetical protein
MTHRVPCPPAPGPLEAWAAHFDDLFFTLAQRRGFREYRAGLLPRDRKKTLTCLAESEPVVGAQHPSVQRLQFFLSESTWDQVPRPTGSTGLECDQDSFLTELRGVLTGWRHVVPLVSLHRILFGSLSGNLGAPQVEEPPKVRLTPEIAWSGGHFRR